MCIRDSAKIGRTNPEIWPIFDFSRWRLSAILDWFFACWDHPRRVLGSLCDCTKFGGNRCRIFDSMQILIFCTLSLIMPIHAPKIRVFGGFYPQNREQYIRDPQKAHPWAETRRMTYRSSKSVHVCGLAASGRIKQKTKKRYTKETKTRVFSRVRPDHPRCRSATWICMRGHTRDPIIYSKFHRNLSKGFGAPRGQNLDLPITLASRFYNSLYYRTSRDTEYDQDHL